MNPNEIYTSANIAWQPSEEVVRKARVTKFINDCGAQDFADLYERSITDVAWFTEEVLRFLDVKFDPPYKQVLDLEQGIEWANWCVDGGLNIAERCVDYHIHKETARQPAVIWEAEEGTTRTLTYEELHRETVACASGLRQLGITKGDCVGIHLPMMPETVIALTALARIGAIAVPVFSGYGASAIAVRLQDTNAKALITCDGFPRRGRVFDAHAIAREAVKKSASVKHLIIVKRTTENAHDKHEDNERAWRNVIQIGRSIVFEEAQPHHDASLEIDNRMSRVEPTNAEDALIILYTSGTTGKPKGIVHTHCGFPVKAAQDMALGCDVGQGTRICWITDIGWMMGPWLIYGALINGGTICLYDGAPDYPNAERMWEFCARHKVEILGISPSLVRALAACGDELPKRHDLSSLRMFASTGEPWDEASWRWLFEKVGDKKLPVINYSGGTEISGGILMGSPVLPMKPCAFSAPCFGIAADVVDEDGNSVENKVGELVIREPWIGMARGFWREPERYLETYWSKFPRVWVHGDWALRDEDKYWFIHGRSDDTLKIAGKRVGPAEVETILTAHEHVIEAAVIGVPDDKKGTAMIALCVLAKDASKDDLDDELRARVAEALGKPLRPEKVLFVSALPKTRNAKTMRRLIRAAYLNEDLGDTSALENPDSLAQIAEVARRQT